MDALLIPVSVLARPASTGFHPGANPPSPVPDDLALLEDSDNRSRHDTMFAMSELLSRRTFIQGVAAAAGAAAIGTHAAGTQAAGANAELDRITSVQIHPAIGIGRVGNSPDAFHFAPEVPGRAPVGPYKDAEGAMARQAARFRIFGYDDNGRVVRELTADDAAITWEIVVGNNKAAWYRVNEPLDLVGAPRVELRNKNVRDRESLRVTSRRVELTGAAERPVGLSGSFDGVNVPMAEALTDERGRLVVMPGAGRAYKLPDARPLAGFADNDGWIDDTCDGPVYATVRIGARSLTAKPARVICTSPNYAPGVGSGIVTAHDAALSAVVTAGRVSRSTTDLYRDVLPILERLSDMQWVNAGYLTRYGFGADDDWTSPEMQRMIADASPANRDFRRRVAALFRNPDFSEAQPALEPQMYGDRVTMPPNLVEPRQWTAITPLQFAHLQRWAEGRFTAKASTRAIRDATALDDIPLAQRPTALDRASLDGCLGGAFHPGIEMPWMTRVHRIWTRRLRLRRAHRTPDTTDYGARLDHATAVKKGGPLDHLGPGDVIKWMGVPWHADSASCRYGYQKFSPDLPGFWPARIPNAVLTEADYDIVVDQGRTLDERRAAFERRRDWQRFIARPTQTPTLSLMVDEWYKLGVIAERPGPSDGKFPAQLKVETSVGFASEPDADSPAWLGVPQLPMFPAVVANSDDNTLRSIEESGAMTILTLSDTLARPEGMTRDASGNLYVACMDGDEVRRVARDGTVTTYAGGFEMPLGVTMSPRRELYVASFIGPSVRDGFVSIIFPGGAQRVLVPRGSGLVNPIDLVLTPDGKTLLVSNRGNGTISKVDAASGDVLDARWITGVSGASGLVIDQRHELYIAARGANTVLRYSLDGERLPLQLTGERLRGPMSLAVDPLNDIYVTSADIDVVHRIRVDGGTGTVTTLTTEMNNPGGIVFVG